MSFGYQSRGFSPVSRGFHPENLATQSGLRRLGRLAEAAATHRDLTEAGVRSELREVSGPGTALGGLDPARR
jgi:hypothetical protein